MSIELDTGEYVKNDNNGFCGACGEEGGWHKKDCEVISRLREELNATSTENAVMDEITANTFLENI